MMDFSNACLYPPHLQPGWIFLSNGGLVHVFLAHSGSPIPIDPRPSTVDSLELQRRFLWPVGGHPARDAFATGLGETLLQLAREYDIGVRSVGLYRQGHQFAPEESPVTVVVTLRREFRIVYQHTGEYSAGIDAYLFQARALLDDCDLFDVHIDVISEKGTNLTQDGIPPEVDTEYGTSDVLHPGASIGSNHPDSVGSFSGLVQLTWQNNATTLFGLASHHVVSHGLSNPAAPIQPDDHVQVVGPATRDMHDTIVHLGHSIPECRSDILHAEAGSFYDSTILGGAKLRCQRLEEDLEFFTSPEMDWRVGRVVASSGIGTPQPGTPLLDWALIALQGDRIPRPREIREMAMRRGEISKFNARKQMGGGTIPGPEWHYQAKKPGILQFATPPEETVVTVAEIGAFIRTIPPNHVYVHGRTTNLSTGYLHDMCEYVVSTFDDIEVVSADLVVLNDIIASPGAPRRFASAGDAGAPVRLRDGRLVGFVREHNPDSSVTYVTLAEPLLRRIAQVAGAERATMVPCWDTRWHGVKGYQYV